MIPDHPNDLNNLEILEFNNEPNKTNNNNTNLIKRKDSYSSSSKSVETDLNASIDQSMFNLNASYTNSIKQRQKDILIYSSVIALFFFSPIALLSFYFCIKANTQLKLQNFHQTEVLLRRANYFNLTAFSIGSVIYAGFFIVSIILLRHSNLTCPTCDIKS